jgi:hypothetical protein
MNEPPAARRAIYDEDLQVRIDAAMARTRRFIMSTQAIRASGQVQENREDDVTLVPKADSRR